MKIRRLFASVLAGALLTSGCATTTATRAEHRECAALADASVNANQAVVRGGVVGGAIGAGGGALTGALNGNISGHAGLGAAIGAGIGILVGSIVGAVSEHRRMKEIRDRYYVECLRSRGLE